jgi:hypothetical protein
MIDRAAGSIFTIELLSLLNAALQAVSLPIRPLRWLLTVGVQSVNSMGNAQVVFSG